jgi:hypothetical protein
MARGSRTSAGTSPASENFWGRWQEFTTENMKSTERDEKSSGHDFAFFVVISK